MFQPISNLQSYLVSTTVFNNMQNILQNTHYNGG